MGRMDHGTGNTPKQNILNVPSLRGVTEKSSQMRQLATVCFESREKEKVEQEWLVGTRTM